MKALVSAWRASICARHASTRSRAVRRPSRRALAVPRTEPVTPSSLVVTGQASGSRSAAMSSRVAGRTSPWRASPPDCRLATETAREFMRQTRIIATLGPSSATPAGVPALIAAGVDIFRFNFSHGTHEQHAEAARLVRAAAADARRHVAILQDLSGPKIRTGRLAGGTPIALPAGSRLRITTGDEDGVE